MKMLFAAVLMSSVSVAFGLKCYSCASVKSMDECQATQDKANCSSSLIDPRCSKESYEYKNATDIKTHTKGCKSKAYCESEAGKSVCKEANGEKCESSCCEGDLCNTSLVPASRSASMILCNQVFPLLFSYVFICFA
ncbi:unnamed protein product [Porites lobata]|uniref:Uncharacterized protein n=1 Tax=Porites lobata TaxID=104759 RepID=A0ABN8NEU3_9CNID|nr:unnamed protein product [Porites lobata]